MTKAKKVSLALLIVLLMGPMVTNATPILIMEVSVDGGVSFGPDAPFFGPAPVFYRLILQNETGGTLVNTVINDGFLGIANYVVQDMQAGEIIVLDNGDIAALSTVISAFGTTTNIATWSGFDADGNFFSDSYSTVIVNLTEPPVGVPEPNTLALLGLGLVGMAARRRKV